MSLPKTLFPEMGRDAIAAGAWAAGLSGVPSTAHALATRRDPLEATKAAGAILLPGSTRALPLVLAAVPLHLALSLGWALVLERLGARGPARGAAAGLAIAALDLGVVGRRFPRVRALPLAPQILDHLAYGAVVGTVLDRRGSSGRRRPLQGSSQAGHPILRMPSLREMQRLERRRRGRDS